MRRLVLLCLAICVGLSATAAFARGGMGAHMSSAIMGSHMSLGSHMSMSGGEFGSSAATPGTNSSGTALPSSGSGARPMNGPLLGTDAAIEKENTQLEKMLEGSICRGC
jgi:hypothetical protein